MSLRLRVFLIVLTTACISGVSLYFISNYLFWRSFTQWEQTEITRSVTRMKETYQIEINILNAMSAGFAYRDDTYNFIREPDQTFIDTSLSDTTLEQLGVDLVMIYDLQHNPIASIRIRSNALQSIPPPEDIHVSIREIFPYSPDSNPEMLQSGLLQTSQGPLLVSIRFVRTTHNNKPPNGMILFGKYLNQQMMENWKPLTQISLDYATLDNTPLTADYQAAAAHFENSEEPVFIQPLKDQNEEIIHQRIAGYALLKDIRGENLVLLRVDEPRSIYTQGITSLRNLIPLFLMITLLMSGLSYLYFDRSFSKRLLTITEGFNRFRETHDFSLRISDKGLDELASLAKAANQTIEEIGQYEESLLKSERQFREVLQKLRLLAVILDKHGKITFCNDYFLKFTGWYRYEVIDQDWFNLFIPAEERDHRRRGFYKALDQGDDHPHSESYMLVRSNEKRLISWNNTVLRNKVDHLVGMARIGVDITTHRQTEQKVRNSLEETRLHLSRLTTLRKIDSTITNKNNLHEKLQAVASTIKESLGVDSVDILIIEPITMALIPTAAVGNELALIPPINLCNSEGERIDFCDNDEVLIFTDLNDGNLPEWLAVRYRDYCPYSFYAAAPMIIVGKQIGVLETFSKRNPIHDPEWATFLQSLALQAAIAFENAEMVQQIQQANRDLIQAYEATLKGWAHALELRDKETSGHSERMMDLATRLGSRKGLQANQLRNLSRGVILHDIGKMGVPDYILHKPGPLTDVQWSVMRQHPQFAYDILSDVPYLNEALEVPYCHHERWDGSGYPRGLKGEEIPINARIFAVIDVWDALTHDRPYRPAWTPDETMKHILDSSGSHFDPAVVKLFLKMICEEFPGLLSSELESLDVDL